MSPPVFFKYLCFTKWWNQIFTNYGRCILFKLKSSFCSWDIEIFVFLSSSLFLLVSCCFRGCSKSNLKVYGVINCLSNNLITHFIWYLEKEKRYDIKTLSIERVYKEHFWEGRNIFIKKSCRKCEPKATTRTFFNFGR